MTIEIRTHSKFSARVQRARVKRMAQKTLRAESSSATLAVYITGDAEIRELNRAFHATDAPTDVLAFPAEANWRASTQPYLGDVIISYERASAQARTAKWRVADEIDLLVVHGILHLLGYDDRTPRKRAAMWKRQAEILGHAIKT